MSSLYDRLSSIERTLSTIETATPRNSSVVSQGELSIVDEGILRVVSGGSIKFDEGGYIGSETFNIAEQEGWRVGTERRGSAVVAVSGFSDESNVSYDIKPANSYYEYKDTKITGTYLIEPPNLAIVSISHVSPVQGTLSVGDLDIPPTMVIKSKVNQYYYSYYGYLAEPTRVDTDLVDVSLRELLITVHNVA